MPLAWDSFAAFPLLRWQGPEGIVAAFTSRRGGVSEGPFASLNLGFTTGDDRAAVAENRRRLCAAVGADPVRTVQIHQVHGAVVHTVGRPGGVQGADGDALVSAAEGVALAVFTA
ncbi:MAG: laccase domain-containing protein, partial [Gaiellales bacterium]